MKKILLGSICSFMFMGAMAQYKSQPLAVDNVPGQMTIKKEANSPNARQIAGLTKSNIQANNKKTRATGKRYFSFPIDMDTFLVNNGLNPLFGSDNLDIRDMWKDSNVNVVYSDGAGGLVLGSPEIMSAYQVLDPFAKRWNDPAFTGEINIGTNYSVDSFGIVCAYIRVPAKASVVDTLRLTFLKGIQMANLYYGPTSTLGGLYGGDTVSFAGIKTTYPGKAGVSSSTTAPTVVVKDILLNAASENDTLSNGFNYFETAVNMSMTNDIVGVTAAFISGDPNIINGDSIVHYNRLRLATFSEGSGSGTSFTSQNMYYVKRDYNMSGNSWCTMPFAASAGGTDKFYFPAIAYSSATAANIIGWQYHWFNWTVTTTNGWPVGTKNVADAIGKVNFYPNPTSDVVNFEMNLNENAKDVTISFTNALGQLVKTVAIGSVPANMTKTEQIDLGGLNSGFYIYTINADGKKYSNNLMVK